MIFAFGIPDAAWGAIAGAFFGSLIAGGIIANWTQHWIENRERRNRRDDLRLDLYVEVVDLVLDNEVALAERGAEGLTAPLELQTKRLGIFYRLKLLGSQPVQNAYDTYRLLVFKETAHPIKHRPPDPEEVTRARDKLIELMANDIQGIKCSRDV
jgi:hypothetical protein